jgi:hypothetical protein
VNAASAGPGGFFYEVTTNGTLYQWSPWTHWAFGPFGLYRTNGTYLDSNVVLFLSSNSS